MTVFPQSSEAPQVDGGGASTAPSRSVQTLEPSSVSQSPFLSLDGAHARQELGLSSRFGRLRSRWGLGFNLILGALASAAAVAMLVALCAAAYLGVAPLHLTRRRLSEGSVPQSTAGLVACGETSGEGSGDDPPASNLEEELGLAPAKKAKVEEGGFNLDAGAGSQPQTSGSDRDESYSATAGAAGGAAATAQREESPLVSHVSPGEDIVAQAFRAVYGFDADAGAGSESQTSGSDRDESYSATAGAAGGAAATAQREESPLVSRVSPGEDIVAQAFRAVYGFDADAGAGSESQTSGSDRDESYSATAGAAGGAAATAQREESPLVSRVSPGEDIVAQAFRAVYGFDADTGAGSESQTSGSDRDETYSATAGAAGGAAATAQKEESSVVSRVSPEDMVAQAFRAVWGEWPPASPERDAPDSAFQGQALLAPDPQQQSQSHPDPQQQAQLAIAFQQQGQLSSAFHQQAQLAPAIQQAANAPPLALVSVLPFLAVNKEADSVVLSPYSLVALTRAGVEPSRRGSLESFPTSRKARIASNRDLEVIDPLGEWEPPSSDDAEGRPVVEHAFSRLPRVLGGDPSIHGSFSNPQRAVSCKWSPLVDVRGLQVLSTLLAQKELSRNQLQRVGDMVELVMGHLALNEGEPLLNSPSRAIETLGYRFLLLDATVAALQLLGVSCSGPWWEQMVSHIPDEYNYPFTKWDDSLPRFNFLLMTRLTAAIRILKGGHRPQPKVLVHLKRCLFCCKQSPLRFLAPAWDSWREADKNFYQQFKGRPRKIDPAQPGPSHQSAS